MTGSAPPRAEPPKPAGPPAGFLVPATVRDRRLAELGVLVVVGFWGGNFIVSKVAIATLPPVAFAAIRFGIASVVLLALLRWREGGIGVPRSDALRLVGLGVVGYGLYQILWLTGLTFISAGDSAILIATTPVITALLAVAIGTDTATPAKLAGAVVAFAGVAIVVLVDSDVDLSRSLAGDAITLGAAVCWGVYTAWGATLLRRLSALRTTTWAVVSGTLVMLPIGILQLAGITDPRAAIVASIGPILYSGLLSAGLPNVVVFRAVALLGPTRVAAFQFLVPAVTVVLAAAVLGEPIRAAQVVGGVVIVAGVLLTRGVSGLTSPVRRAARGMRGAG